MRLLLLIALLMSPAYGCRERSVTGGTTGVLRNADGDVLREVRIHVCAAGETTPLGFGETASDGRFALYQPQARGPLHLSAGEYVATLESLSPELPHLPATVADPLHSPLRFHWSPGNGPLEINLPQQNPR